MTDTTKELVESRAVRIRALIRHIRGEVEWIMAKLDEADSEVDRIYNLIDNECPKCGGTFGAATLGCKCKPEEKNDDTISQG